MSDPGGTKQEWDSDTCDGGGCRQWNISWETPSMKHFAGLQWNLSVTLYKTFISLYKTFTEPLTQNVQHFREYSYCLCQTKWRFFTIQIPRRFTSEGNQGKYMAPEGLKVSYPRKGIS